MNTDEYIEENRDGLEELNIDIGLSDDEDELDEEDTEECEEEEDEIFSVFYDYNDKSPDF
jgi:hypothetical protein